MSLATTVKVGNISTLHEARYCAGMGVQLIGFRVGTEDGLSAAQYQEMVGWLAGIELVAEIRDWGMYHAEAFAADYIQTAHLPTVETAVQNGLGVIAAVTPQNCEATLDVLAKLYAQNHRIAYTLLQLTEAEASELSVASACYQKLSAYGKVLIEIQPNPEHIGLIRQAFPEAGIAIRGGATEIKVGINDLDQLADVLEALETQE